MFQSKIVISGIELKILAKILDKFSRRYATKYVLKSCGKNVTLDISTSSKGWVELQRRLRISQRKLDGQFEIHPIELRGETD